MGYEVRPSKNTACNLLKKIRSYLPLVISFFGGISLSELYTDWSENNKDITLFFNNQKNFNLLNADAQFFILSIIFLINVSISSFVYIFIMNKK